MSSFHPIFQPTDSDFISQVRQVRRVGINVGWYVYAHFIKPDGEIFYVGKGCGYRAWSFDDRYRQWLRVVADNGRRVEILARFEQEKDALYVERCLISIHREKLVNVQRGTEKKTFKERKECRKISLRINHEMVQQIADAERLQIFDRWY